MRTSQSAHAVDRGTVLVRPVLGWVAIAGVAYFVLAIAYLHVLRPDVNPVARVTSEYAVGPYGVLMTSAYFIFGCALVALGIGIARSFDTRAWTTVGTALLYLAAAATAIAGLFPIDAGALRPITSEGRVHRLAGIVAFTSMTLGPLLLAPRFRRHRRWQDVASVGRLAGVAGLLGLAAIQLFLLERGLAGVAQRIVLALVCAWMLLAAFRLTSKESAP